MTKQLLHRLAETALLFALGALSACSNTGFRRCDAPAQRSLAQQPTRLSQTGLFADVRSERLQPGVFPFEPRHTAWTDAAQKRRWIYLPPQTQIDTANSDAWRFPVGTKFWKEFTRDGVRVETRVLSKVGPQPEDWAAVAYIWDEKGTDAWVSPEGLDDALGTAHEVPSASTCMGCHGGVQSRVLGFSAVQLPTQDTGGALSLVELNRAQLVTQAQPIVESEGLDGRARGYLHANCGHCHNQRRPQSQGARCYDPRKDFDLSLTTATAQTVGVPPQMRDVITPGDPEGSKVIKMMTQNSWFAPHMPPLGTKVPDTKGIELLRTWIASMPLHTKH